MNCPCYSCYFSCDSFCCHGLSFYLGKHQRLIHANPGGVRKRCVPKKGYCTLPSGADRGIAAGWEIITADCINSFSLMENSVKYLFLWSSPVRSRCYRQAQSGLMGVVNTHCTAAVVSERVRLAFERNLSVSDQTAISEPVRREIGMNMTIVKSASETNERTSRSYSSKCGGVLVNFLP
jgi:hypothetical protein